MEIHKSFRLDSAHRLPNVPEGHPCGRIHGHSFHIEVHVEGAVGEASGWVMDFADIEKAFRPLHEQLDHRLLNEVEGLENPTSENIAIWIWQRLSGRLERLSRIVVAEAPESICVYAGPDSEGQPHGRG